MVVVDELDVGTVLVVMLVVVVVVVLVVVVDVVVDVVLVVVLDVVVDGRVLVVVAGVVVVVVVLVVVVGGGIVGSGGGTNHDAVITVGRYRDGCGHASRSMLRALFDTDTTAWPYPSRHGRRWAWYVFIFGSAPRGTSGRCSTVVHGPHGLFATSSSKDSPQ